MSQQQPRRAGQEQAMYPPEPIKYGNVFPTVQGELADEPIKPQDAAMMQSAENLVMGQTQKGGPAAVMQSASTKNERAGFVSRDDVSDVPADEGVTVTETDLPGRRVVTETVAGQVVGQYEMPAPLAATGVSATPLAATGVLSATGPISTAAPRAAIVSKITIGEALKAAAMTAGDKPISQSDAAAIQAAEVRATGLNETIPGGIAAAAQSAADANARVMNEGDRTKLGDILSEARDKLPADKAVTRGDAEKVTAAELRNNPIMATAPGGVAASVTAAARLNQQQGQI